MNDRNCILEKKHGNQLVYVQATIKNANTFFGEKSIRIKFLWTAFKVLDVMLRNVWF